MGDMYQNVNIYDNYIVAFSKSFMSPIADFGLLSYDYYLTDSAFIDNDWCYKLLFQPKRKQELTFKGEIWIHDTTYAVKQVKATIAEDANINWINDFSVVQHYDQVEKEVWMLTKDQLLIDFAVTNKTVGFYGRKTATYKDFVINQPKEGEFYLGLDDIIVEEGASKNIGWDTLRHETLSEKEKAIYHMIDTIKKVPVFRTYTDIIQLFVSGYKVLGPVEIGPYFTIYSFNPIEGTRLRLGGRTSNAFSTDLMLEGYGAYGFRDEEFKYGLSGQYFITKKPRQSIGLSYKKDVEQLGQGLNAWRQDNIISSIFRRNPVNKLNGYEEMGAFYEYEWFQGLSNKISFSQRKIWPLGALIFNRNTDTDATVQVNNITTSEVSLFTRFAYKEKYVAGEFDRISLGTKWPTIQMKYTLGIKGLLEGQYDYHKVFFNIRDGIRLNPFGFSEVIFETAKVFGDVPFTVSAPHNGNETFSYDNTAFNLMNFYEFVSDQYASISITHHFNGLVFNKIPLFRKLKWREVGSLPGVAGKFNHDNESLLNLPPYTSSLTKPYFEGGVGIENILKFVRIDLLWRLAYIDDEYITTYEKQLGNNNIAKWGIRGTWQITF